MAFVQQDTSDRIGRRAFSLRGMGAEPVRVYYNQERRTLLGGLGDAVDPFIDPLTGQLWTDESWVQQTQMPLSTQPSQIPSVLLPALRPVPVASWTDWFHQESIVPKVPNWALAGLGGMVLLAFMPAGGGKRRRR